MAQRLQTNTSRGSNRNSKMMTKAKNSSAKSAPRTARKMRWLGGSSMAAAAFFLATTTQTAQAQAFPPVDGRALQATFTSASGTGSISFTTNVDTITPTSSTLLINWQALDTNAATFDPITGLVNNPIDILPNGRTMRFTSNGIDYTVLNRILPAASADGRPIQFNGTVESFTDLAATVRGGNVWF